MPIDVRVTPTTTVLSPVEYRWDADTDILTATLMALGAGDGVSGSIDMEGDDGSWVIFDVQAGDIAGVEVAVWPDVRKVRSLAPPPDAIPGRVIIPVRDPQAGTAALELDTRLAADADTDERNFHFRFGVARPARAVRFAQDLVLDLDARDGIAGVWLLNVPPFPGAK